MPDSTVGEILTSKFAPSADATVLARAASRVDAYLARNYDKIALGRQAPPGILYKSGAASLLAMYRNGRASKCRDDD